MKKAFLKKVISAGLVIAAMSTVAPLGVSADSTNYKVQTGWSQNDNGNWCYTNNSGKKQTGWLSINGTKYYFDKNGNMKTGWISYKGKKYFADSNGAIQTGVVKIDGKVYYFNNSGVMQVGRVSIGNKIYNFASNGQAIGNRIPTAEKEFDSKGNLLTNNNESNNESTGNTTKPDNNESTGNTGNQGTVTTPGNNSSTNVSGLPEIQEKYPITVQASAETKILELMNEKRTEAGLKPLTMDNTLLQVARYKSNHMIQNNYFSHTNPDGTKWTNWLQKIGYKYTATAENIAYNSYDPVELFNQWWNSSGHRQNMMNPSYTKVGIGVVYGNNKYMGTQTFSN